MRTDGQNGSSGVLETESETLSFGDLTYWRNKRKNKVHKRSANWSVGQIQPIPCVYKWSFIGTLVHLLPVAVFVLSQQSWVAATQTIWLEKPLIFTRSIIYDTKYRNMNYQKNFDVIILLLSFMCNCILYFSVCRYHITISWFILKNMENIMFWIVVEESCL